MMPLRVVLQNRHFCIAKLAVLERKTGSFRMQNWHFWNAKLAVLENDTNCIGKQTAVSSISESILSAYHQPLIMQSDGLFFRTESFFLIIQYFAPTAFSTTFLYRTLVRIAYKTDRRKKTVSQSLRYSFFFFVYFFVESLFYSLPPPFQKM